MRNLNRYKKDRNFRHVSPSQPLSTNGNVYSEIPNTNFSKELTSDFFHSKEKILNPII